MKIFISDFNDQTTLLELARLFLRFGDVTSVRIKQGKKRRYAIVNMPRDYQAEAAIEKLNGQQQFDGGTLEVYKAD